MTPNLIEQSNNTAGPCQHKPVSERCLSCILDTSDYFQGLSIEAKRALQLSLRYKTYDKRDKLYHEQEPGKHLFILITGEVKVYKSLSNGRQQIHKLVQIPGDLIACEDIYLDHYSSTAESVCDTAVCYLRKSDLLQAGEQHREILDTLLRTLTANLNAYVRHIANLGQRNALERVAAYLLFLQQTHQARNLKHKELPESLTRTELADMLGINQRTLIRSLKQLENKNIISMTRDGFIILDEFSLELLSAGR